MDKIDKYLSEASKYKHSMWLDDDGNPLSRKEMLKKKKKMPTEREVLKSMNNIEFSTLKTAYYGIADHMDKLAEMLNSLNGDTGMFGKDLELAVKARNAFRKISLGKYL
jgi:hypothetical protein